jgi:hypothetical protein
MKTTAPPLELQAIEKLREEELEEARAIQSMMMPLPTELLGRVFAAVESFARGREQHDDMAAALFHLCG